MPEFPPLPSRWFSGYYNATRSRQLHYMFIESMHDPKKDPVIIWFAGGPGGSCMLDLVMGLGPFEIDEVTWLSNATLNKYAIT